MRGKTVRKAGALLAAAILIFCQGQGLNARAEEIGQDELIPQNSAGTPEDTGEGGELEIMPLSGIEDITAPTVTGIQFGAESVAAPGTMEVLIAAEDDVSGVASATIYFQNQDTGKDLYGHLLPSYYNLETGKETAYQDGKLHGMLDVDQYASPGTYVVKFVDIQDKEGNYKRYYGIGDKSYNDFKESDPESVLPETIAGVGFSVTNSGAADVTAPTVKTILLGKETVGAPGQLQVTIEAMDDISGISYGMAYFRNPDTGKQLYADLSLSENGMLAGTLETDQFTGSGNYVVEFVDLTDNTENYKRYYGSGSDTYEYIKEHEQESLLPESCIDISFSVVNNGTEDITAPTVAGITLKKGHVEVPAVIEVLVEGADDISGASSGIIYFRNTKIKKQLYASVERTYYDYGVGEIREYADGMLHGEVDISHYTGTGDYVVEFVDIYDQAGNYKRYYGAGFDMYEFMKEQDPQSLLPEALANISFYVYNDGKGFDVTATTQTPNLVEQIQAAEDQAEILVDYTNDSVLKKDVFDAVKGTGKTISLVSGDGVQWIFQGTDLVNDSKDIDLRVSMEYLTQSSGEAAEAIEELVEETKTVILRFPENGVLPGKAKIRVKTDYSMRQYLGEEGIYVYYFDNLAKELVPIAADLVLTDDYYIEFEIEHCSYYIMTAGQVAKEETPPEKPEDNAGQSGGRPGNGGGNAASVAAADPNGQGAAQTLKPSPKTGEDTSWGWHLCGGMALLAFLHLACPKQRHM